MDDVELGTILGAHEARIAALEVGHTDHEETLEEHEEVDVHLQQDVDNATSIAVDATGDAARIAKSVASEVVTEVRTEAAQVAEAVAEVVAADVAETVVEESEGTAGEAIEIVEGDPTKPEPKKPAETEKSPRPRARPFGRH